MHFNPFWKLVPAHRLKSEHVLEQDPMIYQIGNKSVNLLALSARGLTRRVPQQLTLLTAGADPDQGSRFNVGA